MRRHKTHPDPGSARGGAVLVVALICLLLVTVLAASLARTVLLQREQVLRDEWQLQAEWLAEAAIDRARVQLNATTDYEGEEWRPEWNDAGSQLGRVRIAVAREASADGNSVARINVTADVPADTTDRARVQRTIAVALQADEN
jgi:type II secretory pathway component PulK